MKKQRNTPKDLHKEQDTTNEVSRRKFIKKGLVSTMAASAALSLEEKILLAGPGGNATESSGVESGELMSTGKIGDLEISRLICGGNLISGYAHSRDLTYVSALMRNYFTDEKILDTWAICEKNGINACTIFAGDQRAVKLIKRYKDERGGKMMWLSQTNPDERSFDFAMEYGASAIYIVGTSADRMAQNRIGEIEQMVNYGKKLGVPVGVAGHNIATVVAVETAGIDVDFYVKTHHSEDYWSSRRENQGQDVNESRYDNYWDINPGSTKEIMKDVKKPWIAYKVLAAGALRPRDGFDFAFKNGADFALVGMFDWQVAEDVQVTESVIQQHQTRERSWMA